DLSLGTKRRVQVAKVFMVDSPVIFLDESTTGMDPVMRRRVLDRIRLEARNGRTILLTTQVLSEAEELCDKIMIIHHGKTLASGSLQDLRSLSSRMFRVSLTFARDLDVKDHLQSLNPAEFRVEDGQAELLFKGEEALLLDRWPIYRVSSRSGILKCGARGWRIFLWSWSVTKMPSEPTHERRVGRLLPGLSTADHEHRVCVLGSLRAYRLSSSLRPRVRAHSRAIFRRRYLHGLRGIFPRGRAGHDDFRHRHEYLLGNFHGQGFRYLLRIADLSYYQAPVPGGKNLL